MNDAQIVILTMSWDYYSMTKQMPLAYALIEESRQTRKQVWSINNGDFGVKLPYFENLVVFRQSGYTSNKIIGHVGFPSVINDYISKNHLESAFLNRGYNAQPVVGFCGQSNASKGNALKEMVKQSLRNIRSQTGFSDLETQKVLATSYLRESLLKQLEKNSAIDCRFIKRKQHRAGVMKHKEGHSTTTEFYNNILESQYILCVRGAGNFSVRFYETLMMGRIPLYVHTDGFLPLSDIINWKEHVVWVDYEDRHSISEILLDFHNQMNQDSLKALFEKNRKLWQEKLTLSGFFEVQKMKFFKYDYK
ncbi:exostosin family protein [Gelidibacter japonicus]|uniref:exostosin domain-containing protein n=1 Tax=Gelidibacter japonicus TaxID=1962232 RepID=UPI00202255A3|nr:exostosin family protein [Gelidibacter japonicus]MCL8006551.1 exostosin family protein [Gelidibacter japonicus]